MPRLPACYDKEKAQQHKFAVDMREETYDKAPLVPYMRCPLCGRNRPLFVRSRTQVEKKVLGRYDPHLRTQALDTTLGTPMIRWDHYTPAIDELFEIRVHMPRVRMADVPKHLQKYCAPAHKNQKGLEYWAGGWRYLAGMTLDEIDHLLTAGKRAPEIRACWNDWFKGVDQKLWQKALARQILEVQKQLAVLTEAFNMMSYNGNVK